MFKEKLKKRERFNEEVEEVRPVKIHRFDLTSREHCYSHGASQRQDIEPYNVRAQKIDLERDGFFFFSVILWRVS